MPNTCKSSGPLLNIEYPAGGARVQRIEDIELLELIKWEDNKLDIEC